MADLPSNLSDSGARLRAVERGLSALRQGRPVGIAGNPPAAAVAVETAVGPVVPGSVLVVTPIRALAMGVLAHHGTEAVAFHLPEAVSMDTLRAAVDPTAGTAPTGWRPAPLPDTANAAIALAKLARLLPGLLVSGITDDLPLLQPDDILAHPALAAEQLVKISEARVPLQGIPDCRLIAFRSPGSGLEHLAIVIGDPAVAAAPLVRVHSECFTGDLLGSLRCDCGPQLHGAIERIAAAGAGVVLYLAQEGRGIGLANKLRAYTLQDQGLDTLDANRALGFSGDERDFAIAATMLRYLHIPRVRLLTNNPDKLAALASHGIEVAGRESLLFAANGVNDGYLNTKARRFGHLLP